MRNHLPTPPTGCVERSKRKPYSHLNAESTTNLFRFMTANQLNGNASDYIIISDSKVFLIEFCGGYGEPRDRTH
jgi:hypothetical protein